MLSIPRLSLALLIPAVLFFSCLPRVLSQCHYLLPTCNDKQGLGVAEYVFDARNTALSLDQRVCLPSNTTSYNIYNTTLKLSPSRDRYGYYCTNVSLNDGLACFMNETDKTVMYFNTELIAGNGSGAVEVNFTLTDGTLRAAFTIVYGPDGIQSYNSSQLEIKPGYPFVLQWSVLGASAISRSHINLNGDTSSPVPGGITKNLVPQCIRPTNSLSLVQPPIPQIVTWSISAANIEDAGEYRIMMGNFTSSVFVKVPQTQAPILTTTSQPVINGEVNAQGGISCDVLYTNRPPSWYFNNVPLSTNGQYTISENRLLIQNATMNNSGSYTCRASNEYGTSDMHFLLIIGSRPVFTLPPFNIRVSNGSRAVIPCSVTGVPSPNVIWTVVSVQVLDGVTIDHIANAMSIESVNEPVTNVTCTATNLFGSVSATANISLLSVPDYNATSPNERFIYLKESETVNLSCPTLPSDFSGVQYQWSKDNVELNGSNTSTYTVTGDADGGNWGLYCCQATRQVSRSAQEVAAYDCSMVAIRVKSIIDYPLPNASIQTGSNISYICYSSTANGIDTPLIRWHKDGVLLNRSLERYSFEQDRYGVSTLSIANVTVEDGGTFSCRGNNPVSSASMEARLIVVDSTCSNNRLFGSTAEGDTSTWSLDPPGSVIVESAGEKHFSLVPSSLRPNPSITHNITVDNPGNYMLNFRCRMRSSGSSSLPVISLSLPTGNSSNVSLPFPSLTSWQWVSTSLNFTTASPNGLIFVNMVTSQMEQGSFQSVFFDDACAVLVSESLMTTSISSTATISVSNSPTATPTASPQGFSIYFIAGIAGGGLILLLLLLIICCSCVVCYCRKKSKSSNPYDLTKNLTNELKNGVKLHSVSTRYADITRSELSKSPTEEDSKTSTLPQPVYVLPGGGETPVYLTGGDNTALIPSSFGQREEATSYEYLETTRTHSLGSNKAPLIVGSVLSQSPPEMVYEDPTAEMYDEVVKPSEQELYEDMEHSQTEIIRKSPAPPSLPLPPPPPQTGEAVYENTMTESEELYDNPSPPPLNRPKHSYSVPSVQLQHKAMSPRTHEKSSSFVASGSSKNQYMSLNLSSIVEQQVYTTPSPILSPPLPHQGSEDDPEYVSITNQAVNLARQKAAAAAKLDSEDDYV